MADALTELGGPTRAFPDGKTGDPSDLADPKVRSSTHGGGFSPNELRRLSHQRNGPSSSLMGKLLEEPLAAAVVAAMLVSVLLLLLATLYLGAGVWEATRSLRVIAEVMSRQWEAAARGGGKAS